VIEIGKLVKHKAESGMVMVVVKNQSNAAAEVYECCYYNAVTGEFVNRKFYAVELVEIT
jgi:hypothetical protein